MSDTLTLYYHTALGVPVGEKQEVDFDPLGCKPLVLLCYDDHSRREKRVTLETIAQLFPNRPVHFAPAAAAFATVAGPGVFNRYRLESLHGQQQTVIGPPKSPVEGQEYRVWWTGVNPWTHCPLVVFLDPMPASLSFEDRKHWQQEMLVQLGRTFAACVFRKNFAIANAAYGFARAIPVVNDGVLRQRVVIGAPLEKTKKIKPARKGRRL